jgi:hypothetical protein
MDGVRDVDGPGCGDRNVPLLVRDLSTFGAPDGFPEPPPPRLVPASCTHTHLLRLASTAICQQQAWGHTAKM